MRRTLTALAGLLPILFLMLIGCSEPPPPPSAANEIKDAEGALELAKSYGVKGEFTLALGQCNNAKEAISKGKGFAEGVELSRLKSLEDDERNTRSDLETREIQHKASERPKPPVVAVKNQGVDVADASKKAEEEATRKRAAETAKAQQDIAAKLDIKDDKSVASTKKQQDEEPVAASTKKTDDAANADPNAPAKPKGPFPELSEKIPPVDVARVFSKGKYCFAYIQLYNKSDQGKRIMGITVFFKDKDNQLLIQPQSIAVFPFEHFKADAKDPFEQSMVTAITSGSQQVTGNEGAQFVAVGMHDRAADVRKCFVRVLFEPGGSITGESSSGGNEAPANILK